MAAPHHIEVPTESWNASDYTKKSTTAALRVSEHLSAPELSLEELTARSQRATIEGELEVEVGCQVSYSTSASIVAAEVCLQLLISQGGEVVLEVVSRARAKWRSKSGGFSDEDAVALFAVFIGSLEPRELSIRAAAGVLQALRVDVGLHASDTWGSNVQELMRIADLPAMDSAEASPLSPFALVGVSGAEASEWESLEFSASAAEPWITQHFGPKQASLWADLEFEAGDAARWRDLGASPKTMDELLDFGASDDQIEEALRSDDDPYDYLEAKAFGFQSTRTLYDWLDALADFEMMDENDISYLIASGVAPEDLIDVAAHRTASQAVRDITELREG